MKRSLLVFLALLLTACPGKKSDSDKDKGKEKDKSEKKKSDDDDDDDKGSKKKAQSTGKEMPTAPAPKKLTRDEGKKLIADAIEEFKKPTRDCNKVIHGITTAYPVVYKDGDMGAIDSLIVIARCAEMTQKWNVMRMAATEILQLDPKYSHPAMRARADVYLGNYKTALEELKQLHQKNPKDPEISFTVALAMAKNKLWPETLKIADETVKLAGESKTQEAQEWTFPGSILKYQAHLHLGELEKAEASITGIEKYAPAGMGDKFRKALIPVKSNKVFVEGMIPKEIYLGTYHLYGKSPKAGNLAELTIYNFTGKDQQFKLEIEVPGVTDKNTKSIPVLKGKSETIAITPPITTSFDIAALRAPKRAVVNVKVTDDGGKAVFEQSIDSELEPRDSLPLVWNVGDTQKLTNDFIAAWVTPNSKAVDKFLSEAKKRLKGGQSFSGPQSATIPQVKALYDELKSKGYSYVMDPALFAETSFSQRTRLPAEVLKSTNAQCIEGAILFATLLEAIGLKPVIVRIPGHAFVGWELAPADKGGDVKVTFLETTAVRDADFEQAMKIAAGEFAEQVKAKNFDRGRSFLIDVTAMRKDGITPQPFD